jgi:hypothetical protein
MAPEIRSHFVGADSTPAEIREIREIAKNTVANLLPDKS